MSIIDELKSLAKFEFKIRKIGSSQINPIQGWLQI